MRAALAWRLQCRGATRTQPDEIASSTAVLPAPVALRSPRVLPLSVALSLLPQRQCCRPVPALTCHRPSACVRAHREERSLRSSAEGGAGCGCSAHRQWHPRAVRCGESLSARRPRCSSLLPHCLSGPSVRRPRCCDSAVRCSSVLPVSCSSCSEVEQGGARCTGCVLSLLSPLSSPPADLNSAADESRGAAEGRQDRRTQRTREGTTGTKGKREETGTAAGRTETEDAETTERETRANQAKRAAQHTIHPQRREGDDTEHRNTARMLMVQKECVVHAACC